MKKKDGFRDYTILHTLYDTGARASEIATLNLDYFNPQKRTLAIRGKGNNYRLITLWPITAQLIKRYISKYRKTPKPLYQHRLFINQRGKEFTRYGINRICKKYLSLAFTPKQLSNINPAHSFRHACAMRMLYEGADPTEIRNRLGHENIQSTINAAFGDVTLYSNPEDKKALMAKVLSSALSGVKNFQATVDVQGTVENYDVNIKSDLDQVLKRSVGSIARKESAKLEAKLKQAVFAKVNGPLKDSKRDLGGFGNIGDELNKRLGSGTELLKGGLKLPF